LDDFYEEPIRPKRLGLQKIEWGDEPVIVAGCEIGKIVRAANSFNWLLPEAWAGIGMPIYQPKKVILTQSNAPRERL
jgi:hypothetical protein